jgi:hypothetical protein
VGHNGTHTSGLQMKDGFLGVVCTTHWTLRAKGHPWTAYMTMSSFIGVRPPPPKKPPWWEHLPVVGAIGTALEAAAKWLKGEGSEFLHDAPEWGEVIAQAAGEAAEVA